jgi:hypothetical protein
MSAACNQADVKIGAMLQRRPRQSIQATRAVILAGRVGKIYHADASMKWFRFADYCRINAWGNQVTVGPGLRFNRHFTILTFCKPERSWRTRRWLSGISRASHKRAIG